MCLSQHQNPVLSHNAGMFNDPSFTGNAAPVDKRGRKVRFSVLFCVAAAMKCSGVI